MRGRPDRQPGLFEHALLGELLPSDHELLRIAAAVD
jgi:hypothetical protein